MGCSTEPLDALERVPLTHTLPEVESRTQGSRPRPRPRTQKKSEAKAKAKDSLSEDRHSRGQGQECSRPRPRTKDTKRKCSPKKKKKRSSQKFFRRSPRKKRFPKNFSTAPQNFNFPKNSAVLESRTGQFSRTWGLEAKAKAKDFKICPRGRPRGQGRPRGLHLCTLQYNTLSHCQVPISSTVQFNIFKFSVVIVITFYLPNCLGQDSEGTFRSSSQDATCPPVYHTWWRLNTVPLFAERQAGKLWIPIFMVFGLTQSGIKPESTFSVADAASSDIKRTHPDCG